MRTYIFYNIKEEVVYITSAYSYLEAANVARAELGYIPPFWSVVEGWIEPEQERTEKKMSEWGDPSRRDYK